MAKEGIDNTLPPLIHKESNTDVLMVEKMDSILNAFELLNEIKREESKRVGQKMTCESDTMSLMKKQTDKTNTKLTKNSDDMSSMMSKTDDSITQLVKQISESDLSEEKKLVKLDTFFNLLSENIKRDKKPIKGNEQAVEKTIKNILSSLRAEDVLSKENIGILQKKFEGIQDQIEKKEEAEEERKKTFFYKLSENIKESFEKMTEGVKNLGKQAGEWGFNMLLGPLRLLTSPLEELGKFSLFDSITSLFKKKDFKGTPNRQKVLPKDPGSVYVADTLQKLFGDEKKDGGLLKSLFGPLGIAGGVAKLLSALPVIGAVAALLGGFIWAGIDAYKAVLLADEWGVDKITAGISGFVAGTESGWSGAFKNAGKWALIGVGTGFLAGGPVGAIIGGLLGAAFGGVMGYIGGERLAKSIDKTKTKVGEVYKKVERNLFGKLFINLIKKIINWFIAPFKGFVKGVIKKFKLGEIWKEQGKSVMTKIGKSLLNIGSMALGGLEGLLFGWVERIFTAGAPLKDIKVFILDNFLLPIFSKIGSFIDKLPFGKYVTGFIESIFNKIRDFFNYIGDFFGYLGSTFKDKGIITGIKDLGITLLKGELGKEVEKYGTEQRKLEEISAKSSKYAETMEKKATEDKEMMSLIKKTKEYQLALQKSKNDQDKALIEAINNISESLAKQEGKHTAIQQIINRYNPSSQMEKTRGNDY